jgi:hypothetical protein
MPFAIATTNKIIKQFIEEDEIVRCTIDELNPRIHHLSFIDDEPTSADRAIFKAIVEQMKHQSYTVASLEDGRAVICRVGGNPLISD